MKFIISIFMIASLLEAGNFIKNPPIFGEVINVASDDVLNVRILPNYKTKKVASLPNGALVGVSRCKRVVRSVWCKVFHLAQRDYDGFGYGAKPGWVNAKFLKGKYRGYVIKDGRANCNVVLACKNSLCTFVKDYKEKNGKITTIKTVKIARNRLKASTNFGAMPKNGDGYCVALNHIEEYLKSHKRGGSFKSISSAKLSLKYPRKFRAKVKHNGSIRVFYSKHLLHYSGSDERDNPPLLKNRLLYDTTFSVHNSFASAIKRAFAYQSARESYKMLHFNKSLDKFMRVGKNRFVQPYRVGGLKGYKVSVGAEGAGENLYFLKKGTKVILAREKYDYNPPISRNGKPIRGNYLMPYNKSMTAKILQSIKVYN